MKEKDRAKRRKRKLEGHQAGTSTLVRAQLPVKILSKAKVCVQAMNW